MGRETEDRLIRAVEHSLSPALASYGFVVTKASAGGVASTVELANECILISVLADWREGELVIEVAGLGPNRIPVGDLVDLSKAKGLSLRRLRRGVSTDALERRLRQVGELLVDQAAERLTCA